MSDALTWRMFNGWVSQQGWLPQQSERDREAKNPLHVELRWHPSAAAQSGVPKGAPWILHRQKRWGGSDKPIDSVAQEYGAVRNIGDDGRSAERHRFR